MTRGKRRSRKGRKKEGGDKNRRKKEEKKQSPEGHQPGGRETLPQVTEELSEAPLMVRLRAGKSTQNTDSHPQTAEVLCCEQKHLGGSRCS